MVRIAVTSVYDSRDVREWSGLPYHISRSLASQGAEIHYFCPLQLADRVGTRLWLRLKRAFHRSMLKKILFEDKDPWVLRSFARQIQSRLRETPVDLILAINPVPIAALNAGVPVAFWTDGTCAALRGFYPEYDTLSDWSFRNWNRMERLALQRADLAIYASQWAAESAMRDYGCPPEKVLVAPFGANVEDIPSKEEVQAAVTERQGRPWQFLFIGKDWKRKGGDAVLETARLLRERGFPVVVHLVGSRPPPERELPDFVVDHGHLCKTDPQHRLRLRELLLGSHFLFVPSVAECFGVVYCEAAAHGLPSLACAVGGTPDAVVDGRSGRLFPASASEGEMADAVENLMAGEDGGGRLALSSREVYEQTHNWGVIGKQVMEHLQRLLPK
jgi:glycosyltransferase involved in cell wall biosynthesis